MRCNIRRSLGVGLPLGLALIAVCGQAASAAEVTASWVGGGATDLDGRGLWSDPANWSPAVVPLDNGDTYNVVIPGGVSIKFDLPTGTIQDFTLPSSSTLTVGPGNALVVADDSQIAGIIRADNASFSAVGAGAAFSGNQSRLFASGGGTIAIGATTYSSAGLTSGGVIFSSEGTNTTIDLSSLMTLNANFNRGSGVQVQTIEALNGGFIDLSSLTHIQGPGQESHDRLDIVIDQNSDIDLSALQTVAGTGEVRFVIDRDLFTLDSLDNIQNTRFILADNSTLNLGTLKTQTGGGYTLGDGVTVNAGDLATMHRVSLSFGAGAALNAGSLLDFGLSSVTIEADGQFNSGAMTNIDGSRFTVLNGVTWGAASGHVAATAYSAAGETSSATLFKASGTGSVLDLASLTRFEDNYARGSGVQVHTVLAESGGLIDLSGVTTILNPAQESHDRLDIIMRGGGLVDLSSLVSVEGGAGQTIFDITLADGVVSYDLGALSTLNNTTFRLGASDTLNIDALASHNGGGYAVDAGGVVNAGGLTALTNTTVTLESGSTFNAGGLIDFSGSFIALDGTQTFATGGLADIDNARFDLSGGAVWGTSTNDVSATTYSAAGQINSTTLLDASGAGTVLDLSGVTRFEDNFARGSGVQVHTVRATDGAMLDLSGVDTIVGPGQETHDRLDFVMRSGGLIDLSGLIGIEGTGETRFDIDMGTGEGPASYALVLLESARNTRFIIAENNTLDLASLVDHNRGVYTLGAGATVNAGALNELNNVTVTIGTGGVFNAGALTDFGGSFLALDGSQTFNTGGLGNIDNARFDISGTVFGVSTGHITDTVYSAAGQINTTTLFDVSGGGAVLDLSSLTRFEDNFARGSGVQVHTVRASDGGYLDLSNVDTIFAPAQETHDRLDIIARSAGVVDLSSLQSVTGTGETRLTAENGGAIYLGDFNLATRTRITVRDAASEINVAGNLQIDSGWFSASEAATIRVGGSFTYNISGVTNFEGSTAILHLNGDGTRLMPQFLEVGGLDVGAIDPGNGNLGYGQMVIGTESLGTVVELVDVIDNGQRANGVEALYLFGLGGSDGLQIRPNSTLVINNINVYAWLTGEYAGQVFVGEWVHINGLFGQDVTSIDFDDGTIVIPTPGVVGVLGLAGLALLAPRRRAARR